MATAAQRIADVAAQTRTGGRCIDYLALGILAAWSRMTQLLCTITGEKLAQPKRYHGHQLQMNTFCVNHYGQNEIKLTLVVRICKINNNGVEDLLPLIYSFASYRTSNSN